MKVFIFGILLLMHPGGTDEVGAVITRVYIQQYGSMRKSLDFQHA